MESKLLIFGDICPDNDYREMFDTNVNAAFADNVVDLIRNSEMVAANLECPATVNEIPITKCGPSLKAKPEDVSLLRKIGFNIFSLANNHILDYGMQGVNETLEIAISAALTGHLVLSTVHTNSAAATVTRMIEMGAKDYLVSSTLSLSLS